MELTTRDPSLLEKPPCLRPRKSQQEPVSSYFIEKWENRKVLIDFETSDRQKANELRTDHFDKVRGKNREIKFRGRLGREVKPFVTFTVVEVSRALTARRFNCLCVLAQIETFILFLLFSPIYIYIHVTTESQKIPRSISSLPEISPDIRRISFRSSSKFFSIRSAPD